MRKSIKLRKAIMVEGKIISKGAKILVESDDIEDVGVVDTTPAEDTIEYDVAAAKRLAKLRRIRAMKRAEGEVVTADENDQPEDFPADDIQALRKARCLAKLRALKARRAKKAEDEIEEEDELEEDDCETVAEKKARLACIRKIRALRKARKAEDEIEEEDEDESETVSALRKARLARIRKIRAMKKAEGEEVTEEDEITEEDDEGVVAEKCGK